MSPYKDPSKMSTLQLNAAIFANDQEYRACEEHLGTLLRGGVIYTLNIRDEIDYYTAKSEALMQRAQEFNQALKDRLAPKK